MNSSKKDAVIEGEQHDPVKQKERDDAIFKKVTSPRVKYTHVFVLIITQGTLEHSRCLAGTTIIITTPSTSHPPYNII